MSPSTVSARLNNPKISTIIGADLWERLSLARKARRKRASDDLPMIRIVDVESGSCVDRFARGGKTPGAWYRPTKVETRRTVIGWPADEFDRTLKVLYDSVIREPIPEFIGFYLAGIQVQFRRRGSSDRDLRFAWKFFERCNTYNVCDSCWDLGIRKNQKDCPRCSDIAESMKRARRHPDGDPSLIRIQRLLDDFPMKNFPRHKIAQIIADLLESRSRPNNATFIPTKIPAFLKRQFSIRRDGSFEFFNNRADERIMRIQWRIPEPNGEQSRTVHLASDGSIELLTASDSTDGKGRVWLLPSELKIMNQRLRREKRTFPRSVQGMFFRPLTDEKTS